MRRRRFLASLTAAGTGLAAGCVEVQLPNEPGDGGVDQTPTPPTDPEFSDDIREQAREVGELARESVVLVEADRPGPAAATGTGWFVEPSVLATTAHGVADTETATAWTLAGDEREATIQARSNGMGIQSDDVAVLTVDEEGPPLPAGDSDDLDNGQPLVQVGHPFAVGNWVVSLGRFVGTHHTGRLLSTVPAMSGNSGSPVLTLDGEVVAMTTGSVPREQAPRRQGEPPEPAPLHVHETYEDATYAIHHSVETVEAFVAETRSKRSSLETAFRPETAQPSRDKLGWPTNTFR